MQGAEHSRICGLTTSMCPAGAGHQGNAAAEIASKTARPTNMENR